MRWTIRCLASLGLLVCVSGPLSAEETAWSEIRLAPDTPFETVAYVQETGQPGPRVVIVAGLHGDEPAARVAAEQIRHWPLERGRLVVVPRANEPADAAGKRLTPGVAKSLGNMNRNFPRSVEPNDAPARGVLASALWQLLRDEKSDWVLDLHEGTDVHAIDGESVGRTIIAPRSEETDALVDGMLAAANATIADERRHFVRLTRPVDGSLARAANERGLGRAMIVETAKKGLATSTRARQHRVMFHRFLTGLEMVSPDVTPASVAYRLGVPAEVTVGVYDGGGTGGRGVPLLLRQLADIEGVAVARVGPTEIQAGALAQFDVVVFSGGTGSGQGKYLGETGRANVVEFVREGGGYVGVCAGAYLACTGFSWGLGILDARTVSPKWRRGTGTVEIELTEPGLSLLEGDPGRASVRYANGPVIEPGGAPEIPDFETLAHFRTELARNGTPPGVMKDSPAIVAGRFGGGRVVCCSPHPEQTAGLEDLLRRAVEWAALPEPAVAPAGE